MPSTPLAELENRIQNLKNRMEEEKIDTCLMVQKTDVFYFSGTGQDAHLLIPLEGEPALMVRRSIQRAYEDSPLRAVISAASLNQIRDEIRSRCHGDPKTIGLELDVLPVNNFRVYEALFPHTTFVDASRIIRETRMKKSAYEIHLIEQAARMNDDLFGSVKNYLKEGLSEIEFAGLLEAHYRKRGHQGFVRVRSFNQEVFYGHIMSGANLAIPSCSVGPTGGPGPHALFPQGAGKKIIKRHEPIQIDYVGVYEGYLVDQARTFFLGEPAPEFLSVHSLALAIQDAIVRESRIGTRAEELYDIAVAMARDAGRLEGFLGYPAPVPFVGHGIGLELDELPIVGKKSPHVLEEGMVIALEPKFIFPQKGLAGIENTFVMTAKGLEKITCFDDSIQVL